MTQVDHNLANQTFPSFRTELNTTLEAIQTLNSGGSASSTTFPFQPWADTTNSLLKIRNAANLAWIVVGVLGQSGLIRTNAGNPNGVVTGDYEGQECYDITNDVVYKYSGSSTVWYRQAKNNEAINTRIITGTDTALTTDGLILCNGASFTLTLYTAVGNTGKRLKIKNIHASGIVTIDGAGSELICGVASTYLGTGKTINLVSNGTNWISEDNVTQLGYVDLAGVATGTFTSLFSSYFAGYRVRLIRVVPSSDNVDIYLNTSTNNGSSYDTGASDFHWAANSTVSSGVYPDIADSTINLTALGAAGPATRVSNVAGEGGISMEIDITRPSDAVWFTCRWAGEYNCATQFPCHIVGMGQRLTAADVDAIRISSSAGTNFTSGILILEGLN